MKIRRNWMRWWWPATRYWISGHKPAPLQQLKQRIFWFREWQASTKCWKDVFLIWLLCWIPEKWELLPVYVSGVLLLCWETGNPCGYWMESWWQTLSMSIQTIWIIPIIWILSVMPLPVSILRISNGSMCWKTLLQQLYMEHVQQTEWL